MTHLDHRSSQMDCQSHQEPQSSSVIRIDASKQRPYLPPNLHSSQVDQCSELRMTALDDYWKPPLPSISDILRKVDWSKSQQQPAVQHSLMDEDVYSTPMFVQPQWSDDYTVAGPTPVDDSSPSLSASDHFMSSLNTSPTMLTSPQSPCFDPTNFRDSTGSETFMMASCRPVPTLGSPFQPTRSLPDAATDHDVSLKAIQQSDEAHATAHPPIFNNTFTFMHPHDQHAQYLQHPHLPQQLLSYERRCTPAECPRAPKLEAMSRRQSATAFTSQESSPPRAVSQHHHSLGQNSTTLQPVTDRYACETCDKTFARPSSLKIHYHSHTGEKPHKCARSGCGKAFSVRSNMKRHERSCTVDRNCQNEYVHERGRARHERDSRRIRSHARHGDGRVNTHNEARRRGIVPTQLHEVVRASALYHSLSADSHPPMGCAS